MHGLSVNGYRKELNLSIHFRLEISSYNEQVVTRYALQDCTDFFGDFKDQQLLMLGFKLKFFCADLFPYSSEIYSSKWYMIGKISYRALKPKYFIFFSKKVDIEFWIMIL